MIKSGYAPKHESAISDRLRNAENMDRVDKALTKYILNPVYRMDVEMVIADAIDTYGNDKSMTLYRGLNFDTKEQYDAFIKSIRSGTLKTKGISSWSPDKSEAEAFAITKPSYMEFMSRSNMAQIDAQHKSGEKITGYRGVILTTKIGKKRGVDLKKFENRAESEVLLPLGSYKVTYKDILTYKDSMSDGPETTLMKLTTKSKDKDGILNYILKNYKPDQLSDEARHKIYLLTKPTEIKYFIDRVETSRFQQYPEIRAYFSVPPKACVPYYLEADKKRLISASTPQFKKMIKDVFDKFTSDTVIKWNFDHTYYARLYGMDTELAAAEKRTLGKEYHKQDQIVRDINKIKDPKAKQDAINDEMERIKRIVGSI